MTWDDLKAIPAAQDNCAWFSRGEDYHVAADASADRRERIALYARAIRCYLRGLMICPEDWRIRDQFREAAQRVLTITAARPAQGDREGE